jgi:thymidylate kinase
MIDRVTTLVTFSGIDGAGKSTQINWICEQLAKRGCRIRRIAFWDDVAVMPNLRAGASFRFLNKHVPGKDGAQLRSDKNVQKWYLTLIRALFYFLDSLSLRIVVLRAQSQNPDYIIVDRYIYDQLVQIRAQHWLARAFMRLLLRIAPSPQFPFILDASPDAAFRRKPEYPVAFMHEYRQAFLRLRTLVPRLIVVEPRSVDDVSGTLFRFLLSDSTLSRGETVSTPIAAPTQ